MQLLPEQWYFQWIFVLFRWVLALFFLACLLVDALGETNWKYLIYLTNWGYIVLTLYFLWSACSVTFGFVCSVRHRKSREQPLWIRYPSQTTFLVRPLGCCGIRSNRLAWYHIIQWILFTIAIEMAVNIVILYWIIYSPLSFGQNEDNSTDSSGDGSASSPSNSSNGSGFDYYTLSNLVPHLVNGVAAITDFWVCGVPIRLYHFVYPLLMAAIYSSFTVIYFTFGGTNSNGDSYIYYVLDFEKNRPLADGVILLTVFVMIPAMHLVFYLMYIMRSGIHHFFIRYCVKRYSEKFRNSLFVELDETNSDHSDNGSDGFEGDDVAVSDKQQILFAETLN